MDFNKSDTDKEFYIHFKSKELCETFKQNYTKPIGHTCCSGKGCKLLDVTSWSEIKQLKTDFELKMCTQDNV